MKWRLRYRDFWFVLLPLAVVLLANVVLSFAEPGPLALKVATDSKLASKAIELAAGRYFYFAALFGLTVICIPAGFVAISQICSRTQGGQRWALLGIVLFAAIGLVIWLHLGLALELLKGALQPGVASLPIFRAIGTELLDQTLNTFCFPDLHIEPCGPGNEGSLTAAQWLRLHVEIGNILPIFVQCALVAALFTVLAEPEVGPPDNKENVNTSIDGLVDQSRALDRILYTATGLLVVGIITIHLWMRLPGILLETEDSKAYADLALSVLTVYAVGYSSILLSIYLPAAIRLHTRSERLSGPIGEHLKESDPRAWLRDRGLSLDLRSQLGQITAVIGPLIAGPLPVLVQNLLA